MKLDRITLFKLMFCALDEVWAQNKADNLSDYLDEASPFYCEEGSFDPAVYDEFCLAYNRWEYGFANYGYEFILWYLDNLDSYYGDIKSFFLRKTKDQYIEFCQHNIVMSEEELKKKFHRPFSQNQ